MARKLGFLRALANNRGVTGVGDSHTCAEARAVGHARDITERADRAGIAEVGAQLGGSCLKGLPTRPPRVREPAGKGPMASILIDKLLQTQVNRNASDLHIAVGQPPVLRIDGHLVRLETKVLEPEDTVALMKSISPERCQQEIQEVGGSDFGFAFGDQARFRV